MITLLKEFNYFATATDEIKRLKLDTPAALQQFKKDYDIDYKDVLVGQEDFEEDDLLTWFIENSNLLKSGEFFIISSSGDEWSLAIYEVHASSIEELQHFYNKEQLEFKLK